MSKFSSGRSNQNLHNCINESDNESDDQLYFAIKLKGYEKPLELTLTFERYKEEFKQFCQKYKLTRDESIALKQIVKEKLAQLLERQKLKKSGQSTIKQTSEKYRQNFVQKISEYDCEESIDHNGFTLNEKSSSSQNENSAFSHKQSLQKNHSQPLNLHSKKLFASQIKEGHFHNKNSPISSIHQHQSEEQDYPDQIKSHRSKNQKYLQSDHHVSFNFGNGEIQDDLEEDDSVQKVESYPKGLKVSKNVSQSAEQYTNFFVLRQKIHKKSKILINSRNETPDKKSKKATFIKSNQENSAVILKKNIVQSAKIEKEKRKLPSSSSRKISATNKQSKSTQRKNSKVHESRNSHQSKGKQVIREIFYRLHRQETASSSQRLKPQLLPKSPRQKQSQRIVQESLNYHRKKFKTLTEQEKDQLFNKLYVTSTQSSMNRKNYEKASTNYSNQIENVIKESTKRQKQNQKSLSAKKKPNMSREVYRPELSKRCNAHCQQFEYEKKALYEQQKKKTKQQEIRREVRSRSKESLVSGGSTSRVKRSGLCLCCHRQKVEQEQKKKNELSKKSRKPSYSPNTKYTLQKRFLPSNISFISDVLQESYNQLFPTDGSN